MFGFFKKSPLKKLEAEHKALLTKGFHAQRNGDVRSYSFLTAEAEAIREKIDALKAKGAARAQIGLPFHSRCLFQCSESIWKRFPGMTSVVQLVLR